MQCRVFVGTVATLSTKGDLFRLKRFDVALVDEATQILEPQLLGLLCARSASGEDAIGKFVLIGDHKQLPAVVQQASEHSEVHDEDLRRLGLYNLKDSLFERLYRHLTAQDEADDGCGGVVGRCHDMLRRQGRMNADVAQFPNRAFYGGLPAGRSEVGALSARPSAGFRADQAGGFSALCRGCFSEVGQDQCVGSQVGSRLERGDLQAIFGLLDFRPCEDVGHHHALSEPDCLDQG